MKQHYRLCEGLNYGDLKRLVDPVLSIDEFRSKMGEDKDIVVLGITVMSKEPADDLISFIEKSYDWVLDADLSSGETSNGNYLVFVEIKRNKMVVDEIITLITDMLNLTGQELKDWTFTYYKNKIQHPVTAELLDKYVITSPERYQKKIGDNVTENRKLNSLRALAGVTVRPSLIKDTQILDLQIIAGIR